MTLENHFYNWLKVINFGFPTLLYGLAGLIWANHTEQVTVKGNYNTYLLMLVGLLRFKFEDTDLFKEIRKPYTYSKMHSIKLYTQSVLIRNGPIRSTSEILGFFKK